MDTQINPSMDAMRIDETGGDKQVRRRYTIDSIVKSVRSIATLSELLRILGAIVMLASMSVFLLQGWNEGNDISRYLLLLSQTGLLAAGGFALSYGLRENKGARVFFGLALISIPANFTILGALIYSMVQWDGSLTAYPDFATWQMVSAGGTALTLAGAMVALVPLTLLCFSIMARRSARQLTLAFLPLNAMLLLPVRDSALIGALVFAGVVFGLWVVRRLSAQDRSLLTTEGRFALTALFIPLGIALVRSMYFYQVDALMLAMLFGAAFFGLRHVSTSADRDDRVALALELLSIPIAMITAFALTVAAEPILADQLLAPCFALVFAGLGLDVARRTANNALAGCSGALVSLIAGASLVFNVIEFNSALSAVVCIVAGTGIVIAGRALNNGFAGFIGYVTIIAGLLFGVGEFFELIAHSGWIELAVFGASAIAIGSLLDRHGAAMKLRIGQWTAGFGKH